MPSQLTIHWHLQHSQENHQYNHSWEPDSNSCDRSIEPHSWKLNIHTLALQYKTYNCLPLVFEISCRQSTNTPVILLRHFHRGRSLPSCLRSTAWFHRHAIVESSHLSGYPGVFPLLPFSCTLRNSRHSCSSSGNTSSLNTLLRLHRCVPSSSSSHLLFGSAACLLILLVTVSCHVLYSGAVLLSLSPHLMDFSDPLLHFAL